VPDDFTARLLAIAIGAPNAAERSGQRGVTL
jgi:hypothetical protein